MSTTTNATASLDVSRQQETRAPQLVAALVLCPAIATILVVMRIYTRVRITKKHFLEDYSIVAAAICSIAMSVFMGFSFYFPFALRGGLTAEHDRTKRTSQIGIGTIQFYALTHWFLKLSIMLQYYRVTVLIWEKHLCFLLIAIISAGYFSLLIVQMVRCVPFEALWNTNYPGAQCINSTAFYFASQGFNTCLDIIILLAPLFILRHSSAPLHQKLLFGTALAFGGVACIISVIRFFTLLPSTTSTDPTWDKLPSAFYGIIEPNLGIACACVVTLRPLIQRVRKSQPQSGSAELKVKTRSHEFAPRPGSGADVTLSSFGSTTVSNDSRSIGHNGARS